MQDDKLEGYLLHTRKFTDSRIIVDLFTRQIGVVSAIFRQGNKSKNNLQLFVPYAISMRGKSSLKSINSIEVDGKPKQLTRKNIYCGFYLNEIIKRCLLSEEPFESIFQTYNQTLDFLSQVDYEERKAEVAKQLRVFEFTLLAELGFSINFNSDITDRLIESSAYYSFVPEQGFVNQGYKKIMSDSVGRMDSIPGEVILRLAKGHYEDDVSGLNVAFFAKMIARQSMQPLLGGRPLKAREFFS